MSETPLWLIVPAAGQGRRMAADRPKQYLPLAGRPVLAQTLARLHATFPTARLLLCLDAEDAWFEPAWVPFAEWRRVDGGAERAGTVALALAAIAEEAGDEDLVLVHDVARPCVHGDDLARLHAALVDEPVGALLAAPVADTMKRADAAGRVATTEPRDGLWHALTPQGFRYALLRRALDEAGRSGARITDEASAIEALGLSPRLVAGRRDNLKITHPDDLGLAEQIHAAQILATRRPASDGHVPDPTPATRAPHPRPQPSRDPRMMRIGHGFDVHRFGDGDHLMIGGVRIAHDHGFIAHSDGDVLLHALCDALLGACALGDIGHLFPDDDERWAGADSRGLLRDVVARLAEAGWRIANVDATVIAQAPRLVPHIAAMRAVIAEELGVAIGAVNVKATTTERLGFTGRGEGIAAEAVALLEGRQGERKSGEPAHD